MSIGGAGIWLPHFIVTLDFATPVRLDVTRTVVSATLSIIVVFVGLLMFGVRTRFAVWRLILGGVSTGLTVNLVHYLDMPAMRLQGGMVWLSVAIAVVAAVAVVHCALRQRRALRCGGCTHGIRGHGHPLHRHGGRRHAKGPNRFGTGGGRGCHVPVPGGLPRHGDPALRGADGVDTLSSRCSCTGVTGRGAFGRRGAG